MRIIIIKQKQREDVPGKSVWVLKGDGVIKQQINDEPQMPEVAPRQRRRREAMTGAVISNDGQMVQVAVKDRVSQIL